jgi:hypothetical protein
VGYDGLVAICDRSFGRNWFLEGYGFAVAVCDFKRGKWVIMRTGELTVEAYHGKVFIKLDWKYPVGARLLGFPGGLSHF